MGKLLYLECRSHVPAIPSSVCSGEHPKDLRQIRLDLLLSKPIACRGRLGLWTPPAEVLAWIEHDLGAPS